MYSYRVVKENPDGTQGKRRRVINRIWPLEVGGLYVHLGYGFKGAYRILEQILEGGEGGMSVTAYKPLYTVKEVSKILMVNPNTVYGFMNNGVLPYLVLGSRKVRGSDLERFIESYPAEKAGS